LLEIDQALDEAPEPAARTGGEPMPGWADGPAAPIMGGATSLDAETLENGAEGSTLPRPHFGLGGMVALQADTGSTLSFADEAGMGLGDLLAVARDFAEIAQTSEERTRSALYDAISRAYDFSLAAIGRPEEFRELVEASGLPVQNRAPMTPVVKLVFGADYD